MALISRSGVTVDLLPFGEIEIEDGVKFTGEGLANVKVNGFKEVHQKGLEVIETDGDEHFKIASLSSIALLKLIAYDDRPEMRTSDPGDIASIISNYFNIKSEHIYDVHNDLFGDKMDNLQQLAARVIGREMKIVLLENVALEERIKSILRKHISEAENSSFIVGMVGDFCDDINTAVSWMKSISHGINEDNDSRAN